LVSAAARVPFLASLPLLLSAGAGFLLAKNGWWTPPKTDTLTRAKRMCSGVFQGANEGCAETMKIFAALDAKSLLAVAIAPTGVMAAPLLYFC
jgi:hypothetical protein